MKKMNSMLRVSMMIAVLVALSQLALAQPPPPANPAAVPIDGGLGFLLAAGAGLGLKKIQEVRKANRRTDQDESGL